MPSDALKQQIFEFKKQLTISEIKLIEMKKVCVRDGKRSRMISAIFLDKIFAIT